MTRGEIAGAERRRSTSRGNGRRRVEDGVLAQGRFVGPDPLRVAAAEGVVGERAGSALGVVDHGDLEQRAVGQ